MILFLEMLFLTLSCGFQMETTSRMIGSDILHSNFILNEKPPTSTVTIPMEGINVISPCQLIGVSGASWAQNFTVYFEDVTVESTHLRAYGGVNWNYSLSDQYMGTGAISPKGIMEVTSYDKNGLFDATTGVLLATKVNCTSSHSPAFTRDGKILFCYGQNADYYSTLQAYDMSSSPPCCGFSIRISASNMTEMPVLSL
jgi:hypothetical protein